MYQTKKKSEKEMQIIAIGFLFLVVIVLIFFWRNNSEKNSKNILEEKTEEKNSENEFSSISAKELIGKTLGKKQKDLIILDIRPNSDFEGKHILDSQNFPFPAVLSAVESFEKKYEYCLVDNLGRTQNQLELMKKMEEKSLNFYYLEGGIVRWEEEGGILVSFGDPRSIVDQSKVSYISMDDLEKERKNEKIFIVDLRSQENFRKGHLPEAKNIPFLSLESRRGDIPFWKKVVVYGKDNLETFQGAARLFDMGFVKTQALKEEFPAWKEKGYEISLE